MYQIVIIEVIIKIWIWMKIIIIIWDNLNRVIKFNKTKTKNRTGFINKLMQIHDN
jgi:hypothetical protein